MGLPSLALTVAPGEETSGTACFQHASPHYHSHPSGALQTMALNIHGNPLSSLFIPHQHVLIYANRVPLLKVLNRSKSTQPHSHAHYLCHLFCRPLAPISSWRTLHTALHFGIKNDHSDDGKGLCTYCKYSIITHSLITLVDFGTSSGSTQ